MASCVTLRLRSRLLKRPFQVVAAVCLLLIAQTDKHDYPANVHPWIRSYMILCSHSLHHIGLLAAWDGVSHNVFRALSFTDNRKLPFPLPLWSPPFYFHLISGSNNQITFPFMVALCMCVCVCVCVCVCEGCLNHVCNRIHSQEWV